VSPTKESAVSPTKGGAVSPAKEGVVSPAKPDMEVKASQGDSQGETSHDRLTEDTGTSNDRLGGGTDASNVRQFTEESSVKPDKSQTEGKVSPKQVEAPVSEAVDEAVLASGDVLKPQLVSDGDDDSASSSEDATKQAAASVGSVQKPSADAASVGELKGDQLPSAAPSISDESLPSVGDNGNHQLPSPAREGSVVTVEEPGVSGDEVKQTAGVTSSGEGVTSSGADVTSSGGQGNNQPPPSAADADTVAVSPLDDDSSDGKLRIVLADGTAVLADLGDLDGLEEVEMDLDEIEGLEDAAV